MVSVVGHHVEWLSLIDVSGPFLSVPVLRSALPNGLDAHDPGVAGRVRLAIGQLEDAVASEEDVEAVHGAFVRFVLHEVLGFDADELVWGGPVVEGCGVEVVGHGRVVPDAVVVDGDAPLMLVSVCEAGVRVDAPLASGASAQELMVEQLKASGVRVGLVTDGERWTLVSHQEGENPGFATWWASLWGEERLTLQSFRTLLGQERFFALGADETIGGLLDRSAEDQREVTTKLGNQTLAAVEILIRTIDRIDQERGGQLLAAVEAQAGIGELYDAAVTVMMRLIFLFYAEENDLLPMAEPLYVERYAASSLRERLQAAADEHGEEVLESTHDGWPRLLAAWRAVFGGVEHADMVVAPYGGSLFDPDRYPFLEGRQPGTSWREVPADPLPIDNRTVLHLLNALQTLQEGGQHRKLSFRALDVEQIGHVYEGMLDHTAARAEGWVLGLSGTGGKAPELELDQLDELDDKKLAALLKDRTGRTPAAISKWMADDQTAKAVEGFGPTWAATFPDMEVRERVRRFAKLVRPDSTGAPTAFQPGSVYVADSSHRGATGTHYTPRTLTEEIVTHTLDPLVHTSTDQFGPEHLRTPEEILDLKVCDPACGSGAFLVQACRYLADHLVAARRTHGHTDQPVTDEEITHARRQVAEHCLHGVDINPMACEMAKLSLWLITLAKDRPFTFLDRAIRQGDSLLGCASEKDLLDSLNDGGGTLLDLSPVVERHTTALADAARAVQRGSSDAIEFVREKEALSKQLDDRATTLELLCDIATWGDLLHMGEAERYNAIVVPLSDSLRNSDTPDPLLKTIRDRLIARVRHSGDERLADRPRLHWPTTFPLLHDGKFDAFIGNPPFVSGTELLPLFGREYRDHLVNGLAGGVRGRRGRADLCVYFLLRMEALTHPQGAIGLVAVNTISEGDSREVGLEQVLTRRMVRRAERSTRWPGQASLEVALIWLCARATTRTSVLDGMEVRLVGPDLRAVGRVAGRAQRLHCRANRSSQGSNVLGQGFFISREEAEQILALEPTASQVVLPVLNAKDLNSNPCSKPKRFVIDFGEMSLDHAREFPLAFQLVEERVKPERIAAGGDGWRARAYEKWWQFGAPRREIYRWAADDGGFLGIAATSGTVMPVEIPAQTVVTHAIVAIRNEEPTLLPLLSSALHYWWVEKQCSTLETRIRYTPTEIFETFPPLELPDGVVDSMRTLAKIRAELGEKVGLGLTAIYKRVADDLERDERVLRLRELHEAIDEACLRAIGIDSPLRQGHYLHEFGMRFTPHPEVRLEALDRLLEMNFEVYEQEYEEGLHEDAQLKWRDDDGVTELIVVRS